MYNNKNVSGAFVLTPAAGKRLIGLAVAKLPEVQRAYEKGRLVIANGTTTAYVIEALTGKSMNKFKYCIGLIAKGLFAETVKEERESLLMWEKGKQVKTSLEEFIKEFERGDVFIKGANAVDPLGVVGGLLANPTAGTWGTVYGVLMARGVHCIVPIGLEKMIPSVIEASQKVGQLSLDFSFGSPVGLIPITNAKAITEIEALEQLSGVSATPIAAGGIGGSEGAVSFVVEGSHEQVQKAFSLLKKVHNEPQQQLDVKIEPLPHKLPEEW